MLSLSLVYFYISYLFEQNKKEVILLTFHITMPPSNNDRSIDCDHHFLASQVPYILEIRKMNKLNHLIHLYLNALNQNHQLLYAHPYQLIYSLAILNKKKNKFKKKYKHLKYYQYLLLYLYIVFLIDEITYIG